MGTLYGKISKLVTPADINNIYVATNSSTTYVTNTDVSGAATITFSFINDGCSTNGGFFIELKDTIKWETIHMRFVSTGAAACWGWNGNNGYGAGLTSTQTQGNLKAYDESFGDFTKNEFNVWNLPQFRKYFSACDNNSDNYMHPSFLVGSSRGFDMYCRRNNMDALAGPSHGRACSTEGTLTVSNIWISK
jgi:hypothetical protein